MAAYSANAVGNSFLALAEGQGRSLTNMQVQKLVFLAHGYMLGLFNEPLYSNDTHAWQWGPVIPRLYKAMQKYGSGFVKGRIPADDEIPESDENARAVIKAVWDGYGNRSGAELSAITHKSGSPWEQAWRTAKFSVIPQESIADYYRSMVSAA
jgi:uncharacterized phage-associated protein